MTNQMTFMKLFSLGLELFLPSSVWPVVVDEVTVKLKETINLDDNFIRIYALFWENTEMNFKFIGFGSSPPQIVGEHTGVNKYKDKRCYSKTDWMCTSHLP